MQLDASEMTLDIFQQTFSFAMAADQVNSRQGTSKELQQAFQKKLSPKIQATDGWQLAWGPTIWKLEPEKPTYLANAWYIVYHPNAEFEDGSKHPTYLIAIAGTPMSSTEVIEKEDNAVNTVVDFNAWVAGGIKTEPVSLLPWSVRPGIPYFSTGAAWGTFHLVNTKSPEGASSPGKTIIDFFRLLSHSPSIRFIVAGHSLGGCLTTSLALTLVAAGVLHRENTITYTVAGPSAGNIEWARQFTEHFPPRKLPGAHSYQGWNYNLVNNLDIMPQLWCHSKDISPQQWLGRIPAIYGTPIADGVQNFIVGYGARALSSGIVYRSIPSRYFDATPPTSVPTTMQEFMQEVMTQHTTPYVKEVGITQEQSEQAASKYPVTNGLQQAITNPEDYQKEYDNIKDTAGVQFLLNDMYCSFQGLYHGSNQPVKARL